MRGELCEGGDEVQPVAGAARAETPESHFLTARAPAHTKIKPVGRAARYGCVEDEDERCLLETTEGGGGAAQLAYVQDGSESFLFSGGDDGVVRVHDTRLGRGAITELTGHEALVWSVVSAGRGGGCAETSVDAASCSLDGTVRLWGQSPAEEGGRCCLETLRSDSEEQLLCLDLTPDAARVVAGGMDDDCLHVWTRYDSAVAPGVTTDAGAYASIALSGHTDGVTDVQISRTGERIVSASWDRSVRIWNVAMDASAAARGTNDQPREVVFSSRGESCAVSSLALAADAKTVYAGMFFRSEISIVDCDSAQEVATLRSDKVEDGVRCLALLEPCGDAGKFCGKLFAGHFNGVISEWDLESNTCLTVYGDPLSGLGPVTSITAHLSNQGRDHDEAVSCAEVARDAARVPISDRALCSAMQRGVEFGAAYTSGVVRLWSSSIRCVYGENASPLVDTFGVTTEAQVEVEKLSLEIYSACEQHQISQNGDSMMRQTPLSHEQSQLQKMQLAPPILSIGSVGGPGTGGDVARVVYDVENDAVPEKGPVLREEAIDQPEVTIFRPAIAHRDALEVLRLAEDVVNLQESSEVHDVWFGQKPLLGRNAALGDLSPECHFLAFHSVQQFLTIAWRHMRATRAVVTRVCNVLAVLSQNENVFLAHEQASSPDVKSLLGCLEEHPSAQYVLAWLDSMPCVTVYGEALKIFSRTKRGLEQLGREVKAGDSFSNADEVGLHALKIFAVFAEPDVSSIVMDGTSAVALKPSVALEGSAVDEVDMIYRKLVEDMEDYRLHLLRIRQGPAESETQKALSAFMSRCKLHALATSPVGEVIESVRSLLNNESEVFVVACAVSTAFWDLGILRTMVCAYACGADISHKWIATATANDALDAARQISWLVVDILYLFQCFCFRKKALTAMHARRGSGEVLLCAIMLVERWATSSCGKVVSLWEKRRHRLTAHQKSWPYVPLLFRHTRCSCAPAELYKTVEKQRCTDRLDPQRSSKTQEHSLEPRELKTRQDQTPSKEVRQTLHVGLPMLPPGSPPKRSISCVTIGEQEGSDCELSRCPHVRALGLGSLPVQNRRNVARPTLGPDSSQVLFPKACPPRDRLVVLQRYQKNSDCSAGTATAERKSSECRLPPTLLLDDGDLVQPHGYSWSGSVSQGGPSDGDKNDKAGQDDLYVSGGGNRRVGSVEDARKARRRLQSRMSKRRTRGKIYQNPELHSAYKEKENQQRQNARLRKVANGVIDECIATIARKPPDKESGNPQDQVACSSPAERQSCYRELQCTSVEPEFRAFKETIGERRSPPRVEPRSVQTPEDPRVAELGLMLSLVLRERDHWKAQYFEKEGELRATQKELESTKSELAAQCHHHSRGTSSDTSFRGNTDRQGQVLLAQSCPLPQDVLRSVYDVPEKVPMASNIFQYPEVHHSVPDASAFNESVAATLDDPNLSGTSDGTLRVISEQNCTSAPHFFASPRTPATIQIAGAATAAFAVPLSFADSENYSTDEAAMIQNRGGAPLGLENSGFASNPLQSNFH